MYENYTIIPRRRRQGRFVPNGVLLETHEYKTVLFLLGYGFDVELIRPSNMPKMHSPDLWMIGKAWEMKCPEVNRLDAIDHAFGRARKQADNVILDLRRMNVDTKTAIQYATKLFRKSRRMKTLWIITKERRIIDIKK